LIAQVPAWDETANSWYLSLTQAEASEPTQFPAVAVFQLFIMLLVVLFEPFPVLQYPFGDNGL